MFLLGVLFVVVLTMISGARELMTPGAWVRQGATYKLADGAKPDEGGEASRRQALEKLRTALWQFAATHGGRFPTDAERNTIAADLWVIPGTSGIKFVYVPGRSAGHLPQPLVYEPDIDTGPRLVLRANGDIAGVTAEELRSAVAEGRK